MFFAQFIIEQKKVSDSINIALKKVHDQPITASHIRSSVQTLQNLICQDQAYLFLRQIPGTPPYWQRFMYEVVAMVKQLGIPTWFMTLSCADLRWPELFQVISRMQGKDITDEDVDALSYDEKCKMLNLNPFIVAKHFQYRVESFFTEVLLSNCQPIGKIVYYALRIEFQMRGSPHLHALMPLASGPDGIPYWFWKEFAYDLAPVVTHIFNCSLENHIVPDLWKLADITPLPKEPNFKNCTQLRPISLTNVIMRVFERLVYRQELSQYMKNFISFDQFAYRKGHNTTMALIKCQYAWLKWLESGFDCVRIFSFDFSKAFDSVPHDILCSKLKTLDINPYVTNWIISFLQNRKQRVVVDAIVTDYVNINRGVPQGTVLGPILFSIMVNDIKAILPNQNLLVKYADDLTLSIPVKSLANNGNLAAEEVRSIVAWTSANRMQLNFKKTWEMLLRGKSTKALPAPLVSIERKPCLKLLGVTFQSDPCNWDLHFDNIISKASDHAEEHQRQPYW